MEITTREEKLRLLESAVKILSKRGNPSIILRIDLKLTMLLIGQLQLAFRHPENVVESKATVESFVRDLIDLLDAEKGDLYRYLMLGFEQQHDEPFDAVEENLDWEKAIAHFKEVRQRYSQVEFEPGLTTSPALEQWLKPLAERYYAGVRTKELYDAMMSVEYTGGKNF